MTIHQKVGQILAKMSSVVPETMSRRPVTKSKSLRFKRKDDKRSQ